MSNSNSSEITKRFAVVLAPKIDAGGAVNAAAIVTGGLKSEGFADPIPDATGVLHSAIQWNLVVLQARSQLHIEKLIQSLSSEVVQFVVFTASARALSNDYDEYSKRVAKKPVDFSDVLAVGLFGDDGDVRRLTKSFSVFK